MATLDFNNSYWAQKLHPFKDGARLLTTIATPTNATNKRAGGRLLPIAEALTPRPTAAHCLGALALLVAKYSAKEELLIAEPTANGEPESPPLFYRFEVRRDQSVKEFLTAVETEIATARAHLPYEFKALSALLELTGEAVFPISFATRDGLLSQTSGARLGVVFEDDGDDWRLGLWGDAAQWSRQWLEQLARHYRRALALLMGDGAARLGALDLLADDEKRQVAVDFNRTERAYQGAKTLHALIEEQAARTPDALAVRFDDEQLSYRQLNEKANQLAHFLRGRLGVRAKELVGVMMTRSEKMVVALLAVLKAGAAYVPINPRQPWAMVNYMMENARLRALLVDTEAVSQAATFDGELFILDVELDGLTTPTSNSGAVEAISKTALSTTSATTSATTAATTGNNSVGDASTDEAGAALAYVIYTSGSTGRPKGVAVEHRAIVNTILWRNDYYQFDAADVNLQMPSFAFDSSVLDIFCVLAAGGCLLVPREEERLDARYLKELIQRRRVTRLILTPSYYRVLMQELGDDNPLRSITVAGEATTVELVEEHARRMPEVLLYNEYGPTENAVCSTACVLKPGAATVPIGRPVANVKVFILDEQLRLLPPGCPGEIYLGGAGLARGYLYQEELTAERFIASPIPEFYGGRLYRTGDWGYWQADGELEFIGRVDNQVKVRGFRIELDEIEARLLSHPSVEHAAVVCKGEGGDKYLAAYLATRATLAADELRDELRRQLPHYMVPEVITVLAQLPLTANGKVDRARLKTLDDRQAGDHNNLPGNETETALAGICADLLRISRPSVGDNLFDHGLNSLKVMEMVSRIRQQLSVDVSLLDVYTFPTIQALSRRIGATRCNTEMTKTVSSKTVSTT